VSVDTLATANAEIDQNQDSLKGKEILANFFVVPPRGGLNHKLVVTP
jgi:hypothetical protein